ncbi:hypothetical protein [Litoreibacter halocynthiae]|uniref:hypothetical protein n=1 Tax=Litoreibacter halocynthiae TaxID=1242689 RepID=UPI0010624145|nr:hypothetical protein [Litoreibacter halocynthiae]
MDFWKVQGNNLRLVDWFIEYIDIYDHRMTVRDEVTKTRALLAGFLACYLSLLVTGFLLLSLFWVFDNSISPTLLFERSSQKSLLVLGTIWGAFGFFSGRGKQ